jgi:hypothetical protein
MPTSERKIAANRRNGRKSKGPKNTKSTRANATKHGLLAVGVTELDDVEGYRNMLRDLIKESNPVGTIEMFLVESAAVEMVRLRRARRLEAEYLTEILNPPIESGLMCELPPLVQVDPGLPSVMKLQSVQPLVSVFQRYESTIAHRLFRTLHELERLQRIRRGEKISAPAALDVNIHHDTGTESGAMLLAQEGALGDNGDTATETVTKRLPQKQVLRDDEDKN